MDRSTPIYLVSVTKTQDSKGVWREQKHKRKVFARLDSATASEFFEGGRNGLKPSYTFTVFLGDYKDEPLLEYAGKTYSVYRTYIRKNVDLIELHVEEKGGTNNG